MNERKISSKVGRVSGGNEFSNMLWVERVMKGMDDAMEYQSIVRGELGDFLITADESCITHITMASDEDSDGVENEITKQGALQLKEYLSGGRTEFTIPVLPKGTDFQKLVWEELKKVPYGQTITYGELAAKIGKPNAARAVGMALHENPIMIVIPCHRIIGKNGSLTGFGGGLPLKKGLLLLEQAFFSNKS